ncbi:Hypothetical protein CINCED_3A011267 [Cinara cedri]|uniref:Uncharacterized protein n=1 Tax=Cinara cedri TaxID=506608 RepID=A0A5E4MF90_9HEMI|nr:Hypothetical protein CINCED_3A011267 [Cinara cedri]
MFTFSRFALLWTAFAVVAIIVHASVGSPTPGKTDAAKIQKNMAKNKAKKTQEVLQFGNQQNRQADTRNYARAEKRQAPDEHHDPEPVPEVNNALERSYPQTARHEKIADLFYNPDSYGLQSLDADDRHKRNAYHFGSPVKRSGSRVYRSYADSGRAKRDLDVDPEELLALMTLLEAERKQNKVHEQSRGSRQHYGRLNEYETDPYMDNDLQEEDDEEDVPEGWLEGPVVPAPLFVSPKDYYINNGYTRKQRALHGSKGLNHYQEEPQYYRMPDYYRRYNF